jgi:hypothetical protein
MMPGTIKSTLDTSMSNGSRMMIQASWVIVLNHYETGWLLTLNRCALEEISSMILGRIRCCRSIAKTLVCITATGVVSACITMLCSTRPRGSVTSKAVIISLHSLLYCSDCLIPLYCVAHTHSARSQPQGDLFSILLAQGHLGRSDDEYLPHSG